MIFESLLDPNWPLQLVVSVDFFLCGTRGFWKILTWVLVYFFSCLFCNVDDGFTWAFTGVYGLNEYSGRHVFGAN